MLLILENSLHQSLKYVHSTISVLFVIVTVWLLVRAIRGIMAKRSFAKIDKVLSYSFIIDLYLQLIFGLVLFSNLGINMASYTAQNEVVVSKRLWPVEHIVLMIFALSIANLGFILTFKSKDDQKKFKIVVIYYSVSVLLITYSLLSIYAFN